MRATTLLPRLDVGLADLAPDYDVLFCDVWGVVHNGVAATRSAIDALRRFRAGGGAVVLITNAPAPRAQVVERMAAVGVPPDAWDDVATSGDVTVEAILAAGCPPLVHIGPRREVALYREVARLGGRAPELVGPEAGDLAICIGPDSTGTRAEDYDPLLRALAARDLEMVCANPDLVVHVGDTAYMCAGAIAERYAAMGGRVTQAGKPYPAIYARAAAMAQACRGVAVAPGRILAIGDAFATDLAGAAGQSLAAVLVTGGIHRTELHDTAGRIDAGALCAALARTGTRAVAAMPQLAWRS